MKKIITDNELKKSVVNNKIINKIYKENNFIIENKEDLEFSHFEKCENFTKCENTHIDGDKAIRHVSAEYKIFYTLKNMIDIDFIFCYKISFYDDIYGKEYKEDISIL